MKYFVFAFLFGFVACSGAKKAADTGIQTMVISTSAQCGMCKSAIEAGLGKVTGIRKAHLDVTTKKLKVTYDSKVIAPAEIRGRVAALGYDADDVPAEAAAYQNLPACCKKDGGH
ncbi:MAG TPA: heavy metal-associated domain-containing protein [Saprospiraceae bacterium]|nr:heavy metal-associated domain-containing protein [Saprospiraceae bacterium]